MHTEDDARRAFAQQFNELLERRPVSARVLRQIAKTHGIAYSTLQSWRTGEHLPRVPDDNPCFRRFVAEIATTEGEAAATLTIATVAWRRYVSAKRDNHHQRPKSVLLPEMRHLAVRYARRTALAATAVYPGMPMLVDAPTDPLNTGFESDRHATAWLTTERDNILATATAAAALAEHGDLACLLADALRAFQQVLPHSIDWTPVADAALRAAREVACPELTAAMHLATGVAYSGIGSFGRAVAHLRLAYEIYLALRKTRERGHICLVLSTYEHAIGDLRAARAHCAESLRLRQRMGNAPGRTSSLLFLADIEAELGLYANTERKAMAALALGRECGYTAGVAGALGILGRAALDRRRLDDANRHFTEQLAVSEHHAFGSRKAIALVGLARVRLHAGHYEEATRFADAAAATARDWGNAAANVDALNVAGAAHLARSRYRDAVFCHRKAAEKAHRTGYQRGHAESLIAMSSAAAAGW